MLNNHGQILRESGRKFSKIGIMPTLFFVSIN